MDNDINILLKQIKDNHTGNRYIAGIDGLSRSGKTTLVNRLSEYLKKNNIPYVIFHIDDHIVERNKRYNTGKEEWYEYYSLQWDVKWLSQHFFKNLKSAQTLRLPFYDNERDTCEFRDINLPDRCVIIIEGVFLQREEWRNHFDFFVFLEVSREKRFLREKAETQQQTEKFKNRYWKAEEHYLQTEFPKENADFLIEG
ncbi:kinase [Actinomycetes bacterium NPDC127524]